MAARIMTISALVGPSSTIADNTNVAIAPAAEYVDSAGKIHLPLPVTYTFHGGTLTVTGMDDTDSSGNPVQWVTTMGVMDTFGQFAGTVSTVKTFPAGAAGTPVPYFGGMVPVLTLNVPGDASTLVAQAAIAVQVAQDAAAEAQAGVVGAGAAAVSAAQAATSASAAATSAAGATAAVTSAVNTAVPAAVTAADIPGQVNTSLNGNPRVPVYLGTPPHSWTDARARISLYDLITGEVVAPAGLIAPWSGTPITNNAPYLGGTFDPVTRRWAQNVIGVDGMTPNEVLKEWFARAGTNGYYPASVGSTFRLAGTPLNCSASNVAPFIDTQTNVQIRWPKKLAVKTNRWRVHIRNFCDRAATAYTGSLSVTGIWFGTQVVNSDGSLSGQWASAPTQVQGAFTTDAAGAEYVSGWVTAAGSQFVPYAEHMISLGYTCAAQNNQKGVGGGWTSAASTDAATVGAVSGQTLQEYTPLDVWIECEIDSKVHVVMFHGDSLTAASESTIPVYDSYATRWALANGCFAQILANHGSLYATWNDSTAWKYAKYYGLSLPDAVFEDLGSNDIFNGNSLATVQASQNVVMGILRANFSNAIFYGTVSPRNGTATDSARETVRLAFNESNRALAGGAVQAFDTGHQVEATAGGTLDTRYIASTETPNNVHLNTKGQAVKALGIPAHLGTRVI
ncbi:SGNH/GDSL hydrolase family protein [Subtercola endophyticus]|uniref:SGNH/GDSL hydrolase family protein n=1 Tax=Subtercola endophyticus TaxID=2895559 RepID=UPI001E60C404|nr:SGNH/GDSL hydrolase family protein [Subtercola endophyticus]UFS59461.1 SGNH/GDSL hydrolase family protein [Subtercola endophyticus]